MQQKHEGTHSTIKRKITEQNLQIETLEKGINWKKQMLMEKIINWMSGEKVVMILADSRRHKMKFQP